MSSSADSLEWLLSPASSDLGIDRKALAGLLVELARNVEPDLTPRADGVVPIDPRLTQLRQLVLGREIEVLARLSAVVEDPEQLAHAVSRILPTAIAHATSDVRLGQVLAPTLEKATQTSIRNNPRTLVNILYPLIVPAIRKSIGETIDETFQSLNESLKHSLSWRGLMWRWEAWRTGTTFAEVVLKHTLVYQVEHVFLIHRHTGLLIAHVAAENAASEDPQLVSSMLVAIQDFVSDSFSGTENQALDTLRLGELRLWSEPGPFATLVAVIRGNPPEGLHDTLRNVLSQLHADRPQALENFDGDSSGFADVEALLATCVALRQRAQQAPRAGFPWMVAAVGAGLLLAVLALGFWWWQSARAWQNLIADLRAEPGIIVTEVGHSHGRPLIAGLRDPLSVDPETLMRAAGYNPAKIVVRWEPYQGLDPEIVMKRLEATLAPAPGVVFHLEGSNIVAEGSAPARWLDRAHTASQIMPAGGPQFDMSRVRNVNEGEIGVLIAKIQSHDIHFDYNESLPAAGQDDELDELAKELNALVDLSPKVGVTTRVTVTGHADATGRGTFNLSLSVARAEAVRALLKKRGVDPDLLATRGAGPLEPLEDGATEEARSANRRVSFTVGIE